MDITNFISGWKYEPARVADVIAARAARGDNVFASTFDAANPRQQLRGTWLRMKAQGCTGVFLRDREPLVNGGQYRRPYLQRAGTCVSRGMARGVQTSLDVSIADSLTLLRPVTVTFAPIYSLARHEVGQDRCGSGDGAILADAAQAVHDYGVSTLDLFAGMSEDAVERLAVKYAAPHVGTPQEWINSCKGHTAVTFSPEDLSWIFDCLAAGFAVPYAMNYVTGMPNASGISDLGSYGPHCRCFTGVFVDEHGVDQLESSESWGRYPAGQPVDSDQTMPVDQIPRVTLRYAGGVKVLAPGSVGVRADRFYQQIHSGGEAWAVGAPKFDASGVADLNTPQSKAA